MNMNSVIFDLLRLVFQWTNLTFYLAVGYYSYIVQNFLSQVFILTILVERNSTQAVFAVC